MVPVVVATVVMVAYGGGFEVVVVVALWYMLHRSSFAIQNPTILQESMAKATQRGLSDDVASPGSLSMADCCVRLSSF